MKLEQLQEIKRAFKAQQKDAACAVAALIIMDDLLACTNGDLKTLETDPYWREEYAEYLSMKEYVTNYLEN